MIRPSVLGALDGIVVALALAALARGQTVPSGAPIFPTRVYGCAGVTPASLAIADLDGDGRLDVVAGNDGMVSVLRGNAQGTLELAQGYPTLGAGQASIAVGDVDGDGRLDVVAASAGDSTFSLFRGNTQGALDPAQSIATCGFGAAAIAIGDVTGDGRVDVVVASSFANLLCVHAGNAQGGLDAPVSYPTGGLAPVSLVLADVDGDGKLDAIVALRDSGEVAVLRQSASGRLESAVRFSSGGNGPRAVAVGDLTGDGRPDIAVSNGDSDSIGILAGNAQGSFEPPVLLGPLGGALPTGLAIGDLDGDGRADLVAAISAGSVVEVFRGTGGGVSSVPERCASGGTYPASVAIGDVTGDGRADIVCGNAEWNAIGVIAGRAGGLDAAVPIESLTDYPSALVIADATGDGIPDVLVGDGFSDFVTLLEGRGDGRLRPPVTIPNGTTAMLSMEFADVTGDGIPDIVTPGLLFENVSVIPTDGHGGFGAYRSYPAPIEPTAAAVGDVSGDGRPDVVVVGISGEVGILRGNAQGTLDPMITLPTGIPRGDHLLLADLDGDGRLDVILTDHDRNRIVLLRNDGRGSFEPPVSFPAGGHSPHFLGLGDLTGDGRSDLVVAIDEPLAQIAVHPGLPSGRFADPARYAIGPSYALSLRLGDVNGDGRLDVVVAGSGPSDRLAVLLGNSQGTLDPVQAYAAGGEYTDAVALGDLDGDGRLDAVVANSSAYRITLCLNRLPSVAGRATCFGDGTQGPCPCANDGASGRGCDNSESTGGALLSTSGEARLSHDDVVLTASGVRGSTLCVFLQATAEAPIASFGDGLLCAGGALRRLYSKTSTNGVASAPSAGEPSISSRSAGLGDPLAPGVLRLYQVVYRDPATGFCPGATFNASRGWLLAWED